MRIGFVGLGIMGSAMAANVLRAGFPLAVYNRTPSRARPLAEAGARLCDHLADLARASDLIALCVTDGQAVRQVVADLQPHLRPGQRIVDHSTISPTETRQLAAALAAVGVELLDAPVTGGQQGAREGTLTVMVGGSPEGFAAITPYLRAIGRTLVHVGPSGQGQLLKLVNNWIGGAALVAAAEGLALALAAGIPLQTISTVLQAGSADSVSLRLLLQRLAEHHWEPGFSLRNRIKDMELAKQAAADLGLRLPVGQAALEQFSGLSPEAGDQDQTVVFRRYRSEPEQKQ